METHPAVLCSMYGVFVVVCMYENKQYIKLCGLLNELKVIPECSSPIVYSICIESLFILPQCLVSFSTSVRVHIRISFAFPLSD